MLPLASQTHAAAEHQRIGGIAGVVEDRAVDGGDAHLVAIVFDAGHDASRDAARMQHAGGHFRVGHVQRAKAKDVGVGDGPRRDADNIADHAADAGVGAAERLKRRGMVVRFDFEGDFELVVKVNDAGVVHKGGPNPAAIQSLGGGANIGVEQPGDDFRARLVSLASEMNFGLERFVLAMLRPGLRQRL